MSDLTYCGFVAIVGRPNVGKSTLLNHLLGQKISITSRKPQTTRHNLLGIKTEGDSQTIFVDTPGIHSQQDKAINRYMNRSAHSATKDVDAIIFVVDRTHWTDEDELVLKQVRAYAGRLIVVVNKVDKIEDKSTLMPVLEKLQQTISPKAIIPMSALKVQDLVPLEAELKSLIPEGPFFYPDDQVTDRSSRFLAAELIREKIMRQLGAELPYQITVEIESFNQEGNVIHINGLILVERDGQKRIIIGHKGSRLKQIGQDARIDMEKMFDSKVMLKLWVKVKAGWSDDDRALRSLGYDD